MTANILTHTPRNSWTGTLIEVDNEWIASVLDPKESPTVKFKDDPLALSCASYREWRDHPITSGRWKDFETVVASPEDRLLAAEIRRYYIGRYTMSRLRGKEFTKFQELMLGFLTDSKPLRKDQVGMLYRLPYFYAEDQELETLFSTAKSIDTERFPTHQCTIIAGLKPVKEILRSRKSADYCQFWFKDEHNQLLLLDIKSDNTLIKLFRNLFAKPELKVKATAVKNRPIGWANQVHYWKMVNLELAD